MLSQHPPLYLWEKLGEFAWNQLIEGQVFLPLGVDNFLCLTKSYRGPREHLCGLSFNHPTQWAHTLSFIQILANVAGRWLVQSHINSQLKGGERSHTTGEKGCSNYRGCHCQGLHLPYFCEQQLHDGCFICLSMRIQEETTNISEGERSLKCYCTPTACT